jgi:hypothetical protein
VELIVKLTELIARYPNRWAQAVVNSNLRGWFVTKMTGPNSTMVDRTLAARAIDGRVAASQAQRE